MADLIKVGTKTYLGNLGINESYIQNLINDNPSILGLGNLVVVEKERRQSSGGRLDLLLKDPEDNSMYEVEVMLGETDPSHIIRSIEYWDIEKRRFPLRSHFSVLIAESFSRRYFNVIQLLGLNIPIIAIQIDALKVDESIVINFTKILDIYEEEDDSIDSVPEVTEAKWIEKAKWTIENMKIFCQAISEYDNEVKLRFTSSYVAINKNGKNIYGCYPKKEPLSTLWFRIVEEEKVDKIKEILDKNNIEYNYNKYKDFMISFSGSYAKNKEMIKAIHTIRFSQEETDEDRFA